MANGVEGPGRILHKQELSCLDSGKPCIIQLVGTRITCLGEPVRIAHGNNNTLSYALSANHTQPGSSDRRRVRSHCSVDYCVTNHPIIAQSQTHTCITYRCCAHAPKKDVNPRTHREEATTPHDSTVHGILCSWLTGLSSTKWQFTVSWIEVRLADKTALNSHAGPHLSHWRCAPCPVVRDKVNGSSGACFFFQQ